MARRAGPSPCPVLHLIGTNFHGGPEKQILEHLRRLSRDRFRGMLASFTDDKTRNETLDLARGVDVEACGIPDGGPVHPAAYRHLIALLRTRGVALLCTHGYKASVLGCLAGWRAGVPVIAFSRGYTTENRKVALYEWLERQALRRIEGVICVSEGQRERLAALGVRARRTWVVHNAVGVEEESPSEEETEGFRRELCAKLNIPAGAYVAVAAGRLSPEKGYDVLLESVRALNLRPGEAYVLFCGDGPLRAALEQKALDLGVSGFCRFLGFRKDLMRIFQVMDLLVLSSHTEGLPNVILEAFSHGKAVVATRVGGIPELVADGRNGLLVPPGDPGRLADAIRVCLNDRVRGLSLGREGLSTVRARFGFQEQTRKLESIYDEVLG